MPVASRCCRTNDGIHQNTDLLPLNSHLTHHDWLSRVRLNDLHRRKSASGRDGAWSGRSFDLLLNLLRLAGSSPSLGLVDQG